MSSHSLLLRLFTSEYFNAWLAVSYLHRYPDHIGIQHYLCHRLTQFPYHDLLFFLPQLCHFLMSRADTMAVESLVIGLCQKSTHFAILTYWYFQAYNSDIGDQPLHPGYKICNRMLKSCHKLLFSNQSDNDNHNSLLPNKADKVKENVGASLVGMMAIMAGVSCPKLINDAGKMAIIEGHKPKHYPIPPQQITKKNKVNSTFSPIPTSEVRRNSADNEPFRAIKGQYGQVSRTDPPSPDPELNSIISFSSPTLEELRRGQAFSFRRYINSKNPYLGSPNSRRSLGSGDLSQFGLIDPRPSDSEDDTGYLCESDSDQSDLKLNFKDRKGSKQLLNCHYFHSEIQFVLSLMAVSNRLCLVPKASRQSSLQAELALLNHNLPADVCIPLWCDATPTNPSHHKVVRISPKDAVVLNSADRVPFLMFVEVLVDDKGIEVEQAEEQKLPVRIPTSYALAEGLPDAFSPHIDTLPSPSRENQLYYQSVQSRRSSTTTLNQDEYSESMRTAAVMLAQLTLNNQPKVTIPTPPISAKANNFKTDAKEVIRAKILAEMTMLEQKRMAKVKQGILTIGEGGEGNGGELVDEVEVLKTVHNREDPSAAVFKETWSLKRERIRLASPFGHRSNWDLIPLIVKTGADLRQEQFALQLIKEIDNIWKEAGIECFIKLFNIMVTSNDDGFIEMIKDTISVHSLKKDAYTRGYNVKGQIYSLYDHFVKEFGTPSSPTFIKAQDNFMRSLVGYSIITYVLQLKDRHNGNILVDTKGHIIHIDFGFMLTNSPGAVAFEHAPFKMTQEYLDILGGTEGEVYIRFKKLMIEAFLAVRKHVDRLGLLVEIMANNSNLPCFSGSSTNPVQQLKDRFFLTLSENQVKELMDKWILSSTCNVFTRLYDTFQYYSNSIL